MKKSDETISGFLTELYQGRFNDTLFRTFSAAEPDEQTKRIISRFHELIKEYPALSLEKSGMIPDELWQGLKEIGIFGLNIPARYGGVGLSLTNYLRVLKAMAGVDMALAIIPTAHLSIGVKGVVLFGTEGQKKKYLPKAASGEMLFAYALTESGIGSDAQHITTSATLSDDGSAYLINGQKSYITNGGYAGGMVVFARMEQEKPGFMGAFIVETDMEGVTVGKDVAKMGLTISSTTTIQFKDVRVPVENLLGKPGDGFKIAMSILNYGRLGLGAASAGVMSRSVEDMFERASSRVQFGRPIKGFELIQDKIVRAVVNGFAAEAMTKFTAHLLESNPEASCSMESSHTKLFGTTRGWDVLYDALQTAGGAGYLSGLPYEKRMRDFRVTTIFEGTTEIHTIYPPLVMIRILSAGNQKKGKIASFLSLLGSLLKRPDINPETDNPVFRKAVSYAAGCVWRVRLLLVWGAIRFGKRITDKEFYLERITRVSVSLFAILAMMARIESHHRAEKDIQAELELLDYFVEEEKERGGSGAGFWTTRKEKLHRRIFARMDSAH
ncbi:MAG: acyl-CoA dehydrogenase family protein [Proteobacteria bacterium]|nr:acyl-CoA dehydrogenase family protein [Pseudomonadota bacterium]MBU1738159.1 acyl-CoA dehydrogenase family protein [Pseudomonadota bacterium]